ncbi:hypothetical protein HanOQP8_Chr15g0584541 [Helianthus annuus]|nr:hypothetical protein HanOQP8_Chr15g0584541 [Helianthus annuus]
MEPFKEIISFLEESRICKALTEKHKCYESHVRTFWSSVRYDEKEKTIYSAVRMKDEKKKDINLEVKFTVDDVRRVLDLQDKDEDPIIIPEQLSKGFWFRIGYAGHVNDKGYIKSRFCRPYKFMVHSVVHALSHRKGAYDETSDYIMNIIACLVLNRPYNISQVIFNHMVDNIRGEKYIMYPRFIQMLLDDQVPNLPKNPKDELKLHHIDSETLKRLDKYKGLKPEQEPRVKGMIGKIKKKDYVAPEYDQWRQAKSNSEDETDRLRGMVEKKLRFWYERDEKKRKRTPKISPKVTTPEVVIKGKIGKQESPRKIETEKKKSPPKLIDEHVIPPTDLINKGVEYLNMSFDEYIKHTTAEASKATKDAKKEAETTAKNVEAEGVKETLVEVVVQSDSSATKSDEFDPTKIAPTSYVSGKQKLKRSPKKKKDSDEEDSTYVPTPNEKKKLRRKRKAHPTGVVPRSVRAKKGSTAAPEVETAIPEVESVHEVETTKAPESPVYERVEKVVEDVEVEFMGERKSTPPASPINPTIHIHDDPKKSPEVQPKKVEDPTSAKKDTTSSLSYGFPKVIGEFPDDLPEGDFDIFNEGKINMLTKNVSVLEKAKAKAKVEREEFKEKLEASKAENVALKKDLEDHAEVIDKLSEDLEKHAKVIDRITAEFDEVNVKYETVNEAYKALHQMIGELHETTSNENKVLR